MHYVLCMIFIPKCVKMSIFSFFLQCNHTNSDHFFIFHFFVAQIRQVSHDIPSMYGRLKKSPLLGILWSYHGKRHKIFIYPQLFYFIFGYKRFCIKFFIVYGFFFSWELVLMFSFISALNGYCSTFRDC